MPTRSLRADGRVVLTFSSGEASWTVPSGVQSCMVECWGPGGAGGSSSVGAGGGGGGGAYARTETYAVTPGETLALNVPAPPSAVQGASTWFRVNSAAGVAAAAGTIGGNGGVGAGTPGAGGTTAASFGVTKFAGGTGTGANGGGGAGAGSAGSGSTAGAGSATSSGINTGNGSGGVGAGQNANGASPGGGGGGQAVLGTRGLGGAGFIVVTFTEGGSNAVSGAQAVADERFSEVVTSAVAASQAGVEQFSDSGGNTLSSTQSALESFMDVVSNSATASQVLASQTIYDAIMNAVASSQVGVELISDSGVSSAAAAQSAMESFRDQGVNLVALVQVGLETTRDSGQNSISPTQTQLWQLISTGLSGTTFNYDGTQRVSSAQVYIFRDGTVTPFITLTSDTNGDYYTSVDPAYTYWVSGDKNPQGADRTTPGQAAEPTIIATGT